MGLGKKARIRGVCKFRIPFQRRPGLPGSPDKGVSVASLRDLRISLQSSGTGEEGPVCKESQP